MYYSASNDVVDKLYKFNLLCGTIRRTFKSASKVKRLKFYKMFSVPTLLNENWALTKSLASRIQEAEIRFLMDVAGYTPVSYTHLDVYKRQ